MVQQFTYSQCFNGFMLSISARHLSERTIESYEAILRRFGEYLQDDPPLAAITPDRIRTFLANYGNVSNKTLLNYHTTLSSLWRWALQEEIVEANIVRRVEAPDPEEREIQPLNEAEIKAMLGALNRSKLYNRPGKATSDHSLRTADRNRAMLLLLLDTGIRASEFCGLTVRDVDQKNMRIQVWGKGAKERSVPFSARTGQAIWRFFATLKDQNRRPEDPAFPTSQGRAFRRKQLRKLIVAIGERAGVQGAHPHRFRHTFAIQYLRNGGDPYTLQRILGHSDLAMTRRYLQLAQADIDAVHRRVSPVDGWRL
jgi:site-specific recombinase XerD